MTRYKTTALKEPAKDESFVEQEQAGFIRIQFIRHCPLVFCINLDTDIGRGFLTQLLGDLFKFRLGFALHIGHPQ